VSCSIMECPSSSLPMNSMLVESCSSTYQSMCDLQCEEGFNGSGDPSYVCDVLSNGSVIWMTSEGGWSCERSKYCFVVKCTFNHLFKSSVPVYHHPVMARSHAIILMYHIIKISVHSHVILDMN